MAKYRVWAKSISDVYLDVEADSAEEAKVIARNTDGGEFTDGGVYSGDWVIGEAEELKEKKS